MNDDPLAESRVRPAEIIFEVTEAVGGGYDVKALGHGIYTRGEDWGDLKETARDAGLCHFDEDGRQQHQEAIPRHQDVRVGTQRFGWQSV